MLHVFVENGKGVEWFLIEITRTQFGIVEEHGIGSDTLEVRYWFFHLLAAFALYQLFNLSEPQFPCL